MYTAAFTSTAARGIYTYTQQLLLLLQGIDTHTAAFTSTAARDVDTYTQQLLLLLQGIDTHTAAFHLFLVIS